MYIYHALINALNAHMIYINPICLRLTTHLERNSKHWFTFNNTL